MSLNVNPHPAFKRIGDHLYVEETISLAQALCGSPVTITHLDGRKINFDVKSGEIQPGNKTFLKTIIF